MEEKATCRWCTRELIGKNYCLGGSAYIPNASGGIGKRAPVNYYGGYVCSRTCDYKAALELEQSMPGHFGQRNLSRGSEALKTVNRNWPEEA